MTLLMLTMMPHILEINITNQCCTYPLLSPTQRLIQPLISLTPGIKQDPLPDPNPRTSLHLSLPPPNGKNTNSLYCLCVSSSP